MDERDLSLIQSLSPSHPELAQLYARHQELEQELDGFAGRRWLSNQDQQQVKRLKVQKLRGRDRIEAILSRHR